MGNFVIGHVYQQSGSGGTVSITTARNGLFVDDPLITVTGAGRASTVTYYNKGNDVAKWVNSGGTEPTTILFVLIPGDGLYFSQDEGQTWDQETALASQTSGFAFVTGSNNQPYLCFVHDAGAGGTFIYSYDGISWRSDSTVLPGFSDWYIHPYETLLVGIGRAISRAFTFDPVTRVASDLGSMPLWNNNGEDQSLFFSLNKRLYHLSPQAPGLALQEFALGAWIGLSSNFITYIDPSNVAGNDTRHHAIIKLADDSVLVFGCGDGGSGAGLECAHVKLVAGVPTQTRVTNTVVPPILRNGSSIGDNDDYQVWGFADTDLDNPRNILFFANNSDVAVSMNVLEVFDEATQLEILGTSNFSNEWSVPNYSSGCGGFQFTPNEISIQIVDQDRSDEGLKIYYRCSGDPGVPDKTVSFRYINSLGVPDNVCTLRAGSAASDGTTAGIVSGNTVIGIDADETILHEVVWNFLVDGVPDGTYLHNQAFITRT